MKYYYILNVDGSIKYSSASGALLKEFYPAETVLSSEEEIIYGPDGKLYLKSECPPPSLQRQQAAVAAAITARLTAFAAERGWDTLDRALNQRGAFAADAQVVQAAYDDTWSAALAIFARVQAGEMEMPAVEEFLALLPRAEPWTQGRRAVSRRPLRRPRPGGYRN
jgi:hypothetical protein